MKSTQNLSATATSQVVTLPSIPELFDPNFLDVLVPASQGNLESRGDAAEVASRAGPNVLQSPVHQALTNSGAPLLSPTLNAYLNLRTGTNQNKVDRYLKNAWTENPNLTLRIIWSTRSIHDGKADKELFYRAFGWLFENHPRTAITNLHYLVDPVCLRSDETAEEKKGEPHGYWKDLLNVLALATVDELRPKFPLNPRSNFLHNYCDGKSRPPFKNNQEQEEWSRAQRIERSCHAYERLTRKLLDKRYRALYITVARLFADQLAKESYVMDKIVASPGNTDTKDQITLMHALTPASKWAPTPGGSHDRVTNISSAICLLLHEAQVSSSIAHRISFSATKILPASEMHLLRCFYQKHILTRGRRFTRIPEPLMSSNRWSQIDYPRVASTCMRKNKKRFFTHDEERFMNYLKDVELGKQQISGATLLPHLLAMEAVDKYYRRGLDVDTTRSLANAIRKRRLRLAEAQMRVIDAQWTKLITRLRESGRLDNSIAVCDTSHSMGSLWCNWNRKYGYAVPPILPALSLSLLVARLAKPPFNDSFITFSEWPQFVVLSPESSRISLGETIIGMSRIECGLSTDLNAVFLKLILPLAIKHRVPKDQMIKRIFVFSDMHFDGANDTFTGDWSQISTPLDPATEWKTYHDVIAEAYAQAGYDVPELVYWNLSTPHDEDDIIAPVTGERQGVGLLSGYSPSLLKIFMDVEEDDWEVLDKEGQSQSLTPEELMKKALGRKSYDGLVVVD